MLRRLPWFFSLFMMSGLACGRSASGPDAVVLIVIDTLRADHVGCYGAAGVQTPHLDALAARGVRFADATTPAPVTLAAVSSLLTGRWPFHHGVRDNERYVLPEGEVTLAERFHDAGWRTGAVVGSAILAKDRGLAQGFESYDDAFKAPFPVYRPSLEVFADDFARTQRRADVVTNLAIQQSDGFGRDKFFLFVHYFDVHSYYDPPPKYSALPPYDGEAGYVDDEINRLLEHLAKRHPLVIVVADHGEGLNEHGETQHGFLLYQSTLHVPVLVSGPGVTPLVRQDPVSLVDIAPTLVGAFSLPAAGAPMDGRKLTWDKPETTPSPQYSETCRTLVSYGWSELRALREGSMKLIHGPRSELYDLSKDPRETEPVYIEGLADGREASFMTLFERLEQDLNTMTGGETRQAVLAALGRSAEPGRHELLESLGYVAGDEAPSDHSAQDYPNPEDELPRWEAAQKEKALYRRGLSLATHGRLQEAIAAFDTVLTREPNRADVHYNRALARRKLGDEAGFTADLNAALAADSRYLPALTARANLEEKAGHTDQALKTWARALEIEPTNTEALRGLSEIYLHRNALNKALPLLRSLVSALPQDAPARLNLGLAALKTGHEGEAREHLEAFLNLAPGDPRAGEVRQLLQNLH